MADNIRLNHKALDDLLKSPEVQDELNKRVQRTARAAGPGYSSEVSVGRTRALAAVWPDTHEAIMDDRRNHRLLSVMDQMRGS